MRVIIFSRVSTSIQDNQSPGMSCVQIVWGQVTVKGIMITKLIM